MDVGGNRYFSQQSYVSVGAYVLGHIFYIVFDRRQMIRPTLVMSLGHFYTLFIYDYWLWTSIYTGSIGFNTLTYYIIFCITNRNVFFLQNFHERKITTKIMLKRIVFNLNLFDVVNNLLKTPINITRLEVEKINFFHEIV